MANGKNASEHGRRSLMIQNTILVLIVVCVFGFFGYSVVTGSHKNSVETHRVDTNTLSEYMTSLTQDTEESVGVESEEDADVQPEVEE